MVHPYLEDKAHISLESFRIRLAVDVDISCSAFYWHPLRQYIEEACFSAAGRAHLPKLGLELGLGFRLGPGLAVDLGLAAG